MFEQPGDGLARARIFSARSATCHLPSENSAVSASAKKKLAPAKTKIAVIAVSTRGVCRKNGAEKRRKQRQEFHELNLCKFVEFVSKVALNKIFMRIQHIITKSAATLSVILIAGCSKSSSPPPPAATQSNTQDYAQDPRKALFRAGF